MLKIYKNILVPVDFHEASLKAARYAAQRANQQNGELTLLNVIETPGFLWNFFSSGDELVQITNQAKDTLNNLGSKLQEEWPNVKITTRVERGKPYQKILEEAENTKARMIILGENHQCTEADAELGTTVYHVTLKAPVPVLTIKGEPAMIKNKIVVPLDLTRETEKKLKAALLYGKNYQSEIYLVSALIAGIKMRESRIYRKLKKAEKFLTLNGVKCHIKLFEVSKVPPFLRVLQYTEEVEADMIIVMTHQEGYSYDNYIGAFAHHIISLSKIPVLTLTASASNFDFSQYLKTLIDPIGVFKNK